MDLYYLVLFAHIAGAVVLLSFGFVMPILQRRIVRTPTVQGLREWVDAAHKYAKMGPPAAVLVLLSGVYMTLNAFSFRQGWVTVALVLFIITGGIAGGILNPHLTKLLEAAEAAPEGPVTPDLRAMAMEPKAAAFETLMLGMDIAILFMMTNKPGWIGSLIATAVGLLIAGAIIMRNARARTASPAVAA